MGGGTSPNAYRAPSVPDVSPQTGEAGRQALAGGQRGDYFFNRAKAPAGQMVQSSGWLRPGMRPTVPDGHGVGAELPSLHHADSMHGLHAVWPGMFW